MSLKKYTERRDGVSTQRIFSFVGLRSRFFTRTDIPKLQTAFVACCARLL